MRYNIIGKCLTNELLLMHFLVYYITMFLLLSTIQKDLLLDGYEYRKNRRLINTQKWRYTNSLCKSIVTDISG